MFCRKCGCSLKETEKFCPKCGTLVKADSQSGGSSGFNVSMGSGGLFMSQETAGAESGGANKAAEGVGAATEKVKKMGEDGKKLLQKVKPPLLIAVGCIVLVLVGVVANAGRVGNFVHKTFSSPEKYYQYVEKKAMEEMSSAIGDMYSSYILDWVKWYDKSISGEVSIEIGEAGEDFMELAEAGGVDLSWLKSLSIKGDVNLKEDIISFGAAFGLNKKDLMSANVLMDMDGESLYLQVPELSKTYLGAEMDGEFEDYQDFLEEYKEMASAFPSESQVEKIVERYIKVALGCIDDVSKDKVSLKAEGVTQKCTELEVTIDEDVLEDMLEAILEEMQDDKDIEKLIVDFVEALGEDGDDAYDEFVEGIEEISRYTGSLGIEGDLVMKVYVDGKGEIRGRSIEVGEGMSSVEVNWLMPVKGGKFGYELSAKSEGVKAEIVGSGKTSGDKITGDFDVKVGPLSIMNVKVDGLDKGKLKRGQVYGEMELSLSSGIGEMAGMISGSYMAAPVMSVIQDMVFTIDSKASGSSGDVKFGIKYDDEEVGAVAVSYKTGSGSKKSLPSGKNVIMAEDADDWLETCDWDNLISALEKADVPDEVIEVFEILEDGDIGSLMRYGNYLF